MTVASAHNRNSYVGDCTTVAFQYTFRILDQTHLRVLVDCDLRTLTTHYSVTGVGNTNGGTVTLVTAPNEGESVIILRSVPITQETDIPEGSRISGATLERMPDKLTMIAQQHDEEIGRAIKLPETSELVDVDMAVPGAGQVISWNDAGTALITRTITATGVATATLIGYTTAGVPSGLEAGTLFRLTDGLQDVRMAIASGHHSISGEVARVKAFQATAGDGSTECGAAFRAAHDGLPSTGGVMLVDPGTYMVNPKWGANDCLIMCPITKKNVKIIGPGAGLATVKVISGADNYVGLFCAPVIAPAGSETDISGFELRGMTIDWNYAGNTLASAAPLKVSAGGGHATRRAGVFARRASNVVIDSNRFLDTPRQAVFLAPSRDCASWECVRYVTVSNNIFETTISDSGFDDDSTDTIEDPSFDITAVLLAGQHLSIVNNYLKGRPVTYFLARTALQATGCNVLISGNLIEKWYRGILVGTGDGATTTSENTVVTDNTILDANGGIEIHAKNTGDFGDLKFQTSPSTKNVVISGNSIHLDKNRYARNVSDGDTPFGITTYRNNTLGIENLTISDNVINFVEYLASGDGGAGIRFETHSDATGCSRNVTIADNIVRNSPIAGVYVSNGTGHCIRGLLIRGNLIQNPGTRQLVNNKQGISLVLACTVSQVVIEENLIRDSRDQVAGQTCTIDQGIRFAGGAGACCDLYVRQNVVSVPSCQSNVPVVTLASNRFSPYIDHVIACGRFTPLNQQDTMFGSRVLETETGTTHVQTAYPQGSTWGCNRTIHYEQVVRTTDAVATQIISYPLPACGAYLVRMTAVATGGTHRAGYIREGLFWRNTGNATIQGTSVSSTFTEESTNAWNADMDASGANVRVRVTGCASDIINWRARLDITPVQEG